MKIGGAVGNGTLPFTEKERKAIKALFAKQLTKHFGKDFFKSFTICYSEKGLCANQLVVVANFAQPFNGRNKFLEKCFNVDSICFHCHKHKVKWVEVKKPESYEIDHYIMPGEPGCPDHDYSCSVKMTGWCKPYRARHTESIQNWSPYVYGTEIDDLAYNKETLDGLKLSVTEIGKYELAYRRSYYIKSNNE